MGDPAFDELIPFLMFRIEKYDRDEALRDRKPDGAAAVLRRPYHDVAQSAVARSLRALLEVADPDRIVFGSDFPYSRSPEDDLAEACCGVSVSAGFDAALGHERECGKTAKLFPRLVP